MAVVIPIISEFDGKGLNKAIKEFQQLETSGEKAQFALKKAAVPAAAALAGVAFAIGSATKAAIEDEKAQQLLALAIENNTVAGAANVKVAEAYIEKTMMSAAVADDVLRPALASLVQSTGDLTFSQDLLNTALDISAATGTDLTTVTDALSKAAVGNMKALGNLVPSVRDNIKEGQSLDQVMKELSFTVGGAAAVAANSAEGQMKRLSLTISETKESIGAAFLPVLEKLLPKLQSFAKFAQENTGIITGLIVSVGLLSAAILVLNTAIKVATAAQIVFNFALTANPIGIVIVAIAGIVASFALLINKTGSVTNAFKYMANSIIDVFEGIADAFNFMINGIIAAINLIPGVNIPLIPKVVLPKFSFASPGNSTPGTSPGVSAGPDLLERSLIKAMPAGGPAVVVAPKIGGGGGGGQMSILPIGMDGQIPIIGGGFSGGGGGGIGAGMGNEAMLDGMAGGSGNTINIVINAAVAEASLGSKIVDALTDYNRRSGPLDLQIAG